MACLCKPNAPPSCAPLPPAPAPPPPPPLPPSWPGFACPNGTGVLNSTHRCSSPVAHCPAGSAVRAATAPGHYALLGVAGLYVSEAICPAGSYCLQGERVLCRAGTYGAEQGLQNASCSGNCSAGYFCAAGSTLATQAPCFDDASYYCPQVTFCGLSLEVSGEQRPCQGCCFVVPPFLVMA